MSEDWHVVEDVGSSPDVITDLIVLAKKERLPPNYSLIENTIDGKKADFAEGTILVTKRYLCFTRKSPSPRKGRVAIAEMKVLSHSDQTMLGYEAITRTDDDGSKPFSSKQLLVKYVPYEEAREAVVDIAVLSASKKELVPSGYKRLPELNGFSICYKTKKMEKRRSSAGGQQQNQQQPVETITATLSAPPLAFSRHGTIMARAVKTDIDGVKFQLCDNEVNKFIVQYAFTELQLLSADEIQNKYSFDWEESRRCAGAN